MVERKGYDCHRDSCACTTCVHSIMHSTRGLTHASTHANIVPVRSLLLFIEVDYNGVEEHSSSDLAVAWACISGVIHSISIIVSSTSISSSITCTHVIINSVTSASLKPQSFQLFTQTCHCSQKCVLFQYNVSNEELCLGIGNCQLATEFLTC